MNRPLKLIMAMLVALTAACTNPAHIAGCFGGNGNSTTSLVNFASIPSGWK